MVNRIRDIRKAKGLTLAQLAQACSPPTTAQTIGRLETGMRNLSLQWMNRIAAALEVEAHTLLQSQSAPRPMIVASLRSEGPEALTAAREAILPSDLLSVSPGQTHNAQIVLAIEESMGEYRAGDQLWLEQLPPEAAASAINRDVLLPRSGGRFAFGRLIDRQGSLIGILPPGLGQKQQVIDNPAWIGLARMLVRTL